MEEYKTHVQSDIVEATFWSCQKYDIRTLGHFVLGLPGDDKNSIMNIIPFAKRLKCDYASFNIAMSLPGTELRKKCINHGWTANEYREYGLSSDEAAINTNCLSSSDWEKLQKEAYRRFYFRISNIFRMLFQVRSRHELFSLFRKEWAILKK